MDKQEINESVEWHVDHWRCPCGNRPVSSGFFPCDETGRLVDPMEMGWPRRLQCCERCGRIIDLDTFRVVGNRNA